MDEMRINVCFDERSTLIDVSDDIEFENFKALCAAEFGFESTDGFQVIVNGSAIPIESREKPLRTLGVGDNDLVLIMPNQRRMSQGSAPDPGNAPQANIDAIRSMIASNPQRLAQLKREAPGLADAIERGDQGEIMRQISQLMGGAGGFGSQPMDAQPFDPYDPAIQERMYEEIRRQNVDANLEHALEHSPESFGHVVMLYIDAKVNGQPVKAFVDSGAQMTIMSKSCAERCNLMKLLDTRFSGIAKGVGVQKILGRIHLGLLQIGNDFLQCTFSVLEDQEMDFLLGLDMLRRHQCSIDLKENALIIGTTGNRTPFLPESEIPHHARLNYEPPESDRQKLADKLAAQESQKNGSASTSGPAVNNNRPTSAGNRLGGASYPETMLDEITKRGFTREEAARALADHNGDSKKALANLLVAKLTRAQSAKGQRKQ